MKYKLSFLFAFLFLGAFAQNVQFADAIFKAYLLSSSARNTIAKDLNGFYVAIDANSDGEIQNSEAEQIGSLNIWMPDKISDYTGINSFTNLSILDMRFLSSTIDQDFSILSLDNLEFLKSVYLQDILSNSVSIKNCNNLETVDFESTISNNASAQYVEIKNLQIENCNVLNKISANGIHFSIDNFTVSGCDNLSSIASISGQNFNISNCSNLQDLNIGSNVNLLISGCENIKTLNLYDYQSDTFDSYQYSLPLLENLIVAGSNNKISPPSPLKLINVKNFPTIKSLDVSYVSVKDLDASNLKFLEGLSASSNLFADNYLETINAEGCDNLKVISFYSQGKLREINLKNCKSLTSLINDDSIESILGLKSLNLEGCLSLNYLKFINNQQFSYLNLKNCPNLSQLFLSNNNLSSIEYDTFPSLFFLDISQNQFTSINFNAPNLTNLHAYYNKISSIDTTHLKKLERLYCQNNNLKTLDLSENTNLDVLEINDNPNLENLFLKNGKNQQFSYYPSPTDPFTNTSIKYICADDSEIDYIKTLLANKNITNCNVNSYCSFVPGGDYNTITGKVRFDENENGCDLGDEFFEHLRLEINDGTNTGITFSEKDGTYQFYTQAGNFNITAKPENLELFTAIPQIFATSFADNHNNTFNQDICVTKNGTKNDLEVVFAPVIAAKPGFDATYKLIWRNKGNTTLSGNVTLNFDDSKMNFISSVLPSMISGNQLIFNYTDLKPYENKESEITFNVNAPTNLTNPVNIGDILNFSAQINPINFDIHPEDNTFSLKQTVVGSFDPNEIICLEGASIPESMVGDFLHYFVNFENSGTAETENIVVEMDINPDDFDINTLQLINTTFPVYTRITGNKVEFIMKKVKVKSGGHGSVALKIRTQNTKTKGNSVANKANIYFDYNFPVETNNAVTNIEELMRVNETKDNSVVVFPLPTKGELNIQADSKILSVEIYDANGRIVQKHIDNFKKTKFIIRSSNSGIYYLKIRSEKGVMVKKVIKE